jgi:hypothetical protein
LNGIPKNHDKGSEPTQSHMAGDLTFRLGRINPRLAPITTRR